MTPTPKTSDYYFTRMLIWLGISVAAGVAWTPLGSVFVRVAETPSGKLAALLVFSAAGLIAAIIGLIMGIIHGIKSLKASR